MITRNETDYALTNPKLSSSQFSELEEINEKETARHCSLHALKLQVERCYVCMTADSNPAKTSNIQQQS